MTREESYNATDPAFLASRSLDGDLTPDERARLEAALNASASLQALLGELRSVDRLLRRWAAAPLDIDWRGHALRVTAALHDGVGTDNRNVVEGAGERVARQNDPADFDRTSAVTSDAVDAHGSDAARAGDLDRVDRLLARWAGNRLRIDADAYTRTVLAKLKTRPSRRVSPWRFVFRVGVPLAAAAALVLLVTTGPWRVRSGTPVCKVAYGLQGMQPPAPDDAVSATKRVVRFQRTAAPVHVPRPAVGITVVTIGVGASSSPLTAGPPL